MKTRFRSYFTSAYGAVALWGKVAALALVTTTASAQTSTERITIAALGDSLTAGFGLLPDNGLVPQLEDWLQERGHDVHVINAGVSGDTTAGGLARVEWTLTPQVDAMILALGANDFLRGIDPAVTRANLSGILDVAGDLPVLMVGIIASNQYGPEYRDAFNAIYPELSAQYGAALDTDYFNAFRAPIADGADLSDFMLMDGLHPNAAGIALIVETLGPQVEDLIARVPSP